MQQFTTSDIDIDTYGSIWGEKQILQLGMHFNIYNQYNTWYLNNQLSLIPNSSILPSSVIMANSKLPGASVSGNFGEVLTIMALEKKVSPNYLRICHLCPRPGVQIKCPDLLLETAPFFQEYNDYIRNSRQALPPLPPLIPGECKNSDFLGALRQLSVYWNQIGPRSALFGYGLISTINYRQNATLKFHILVPLDKPKLESTLVSKPVNELIQKDFRGGLYGF